jgi:hypothetical protein
MILGLGIMFIPFFQDVPADAELLRRDPIASVGPALRGQSGDCGRTGAGVPSQALPVPRYSKVPNR